MSPPITAILVIRRVRRERVPPGGKQNRWLGPIFWLAAGVEFDATSADATPLEMISISEAARIIGVKKSTLSRQVESGSVRSHGGKVVLTELVADRASNVNLAQSRRRPAEPKGENGASKRPLASARDAGNTLTHKQFPGGHTTTRARIVGAGSTMMAARMRASCLARIPDRA